MNKEKSQSILRMREVEHKTYRTIGISLGVSPSRASSLYKKAVQERNRQNRDPFYSLSIRLCNVLFMRNIRTVKQLKKEIQSGKLHPNNYGYWSARNYGWKTHSAVREFLGLAPEIPHGKHFHIPPPPSTTPIK